MDQTAAPAPEQAAARNPQADAAPGRQAVGAAMGRSLERAALRDMSMGRREEHRRENAADAAAVDRARRERNERLDALDAEERALRAARQLAMAEQRVPWIDAHERTVQARRALRAALREERAAGAPADRERLDRARRERNERLDALEAEGRALAGRQAAALEGLRAPWNDARGRAIAAKRAMRADLRTWRAEDAQGRPGRTAAADHARAERNAASDERWERARKANLEHAVAVVELRDAQRAEKPAPPDELARLRSRAEELRERAERLEHEARAADLAADQARFEASQRVAADRAFGEAQLRADWLDAHACEVRARRGARAAVRAWQGEHRAERQAALADLRARRNAVNEDYAAQVNAVYAARGCAEADLREDYLDRCAFERAERRGAQAANRAYARESRPALAAALDRLRHARNAVQDAFARTVFDIRRDRELARGEERDAARDAARDVLDAYHAARADAAAQQGSPNAAQA